MSFGHIILPLSYKQVHRAKGLSIKPATMVTELKIFIMNIILFDTAQEHGNLLPLTFTRPIASLRIGIVTLQQKWEMLLPGTYSHLTQDYLATKFPTVYTDDNIFIAAHLIASQSLALQIANLKPGEAIADEKEIWAYRGSRFDPQNSVPCKRIAPEQQPDAIRFPYDIFSKNGKEIEADFIRITQGRHSAPLSQTCTLIGPAERLFIEEGATIECSTLNTTKGYIYIGHNAEIMETCAIRGPLALCQHAVLNMGTKVYGPTTLGPYCKAGGELNNVVFLGYSNKAHDGFLGNAVIGEWCNLGADTVASNLKNTYAEVRVWNYPAKRFIKTGLQFCGLIMGDHSKAGINTMFNTATVTGVGCNIYGPGFPRTFIPSFSEGGAHGFTEMGLSRFFDIAERVMARRHKELTDVDRQLYTYLYEYRNEI